MGAGRKMMEFIPENTRKKMKLLLKSRPNDKATYTYDPNLGEYRNMTWEDYCCNEGERIAQYVNKFAEVREADGKCSLWMGKWK